MTTSKPLAGIRVIDLTRVLAGPYCTMILKNLGAEIIKVESPEGDDSRQFGPFIDNDKNKSAYFFSVNCGKKSISLDLKKAEGKEILTRLIETSDVLIENFRPGTMKRLGFASDYVKELNPGIVYATASGFGHSGPASEKAAYDSIVQALSGIISITGTEEGETVRVGTSISDIVTGCYTAIGILAALFRREKAKIGARVDVAMLDSTVAVLENAIARFQVAGKPPVPIGSRHPSITPFETFQTSDTEIMIAAGNDKLFAAFCEIIEREDLTEDSRFSTNLLRTENHKELKEIITTTLSKNTTEFWLDCLSKKRIPCAKINTIEDLFHDKQLASRNMLISIEGENDFKIAGNPVKFGGEADDLYAAKPPTLGEHTMEILEELGYSQKKIKALVEAGVLKVQFPQR